MNKIILSIGIFGGVLSLSNAQSYETIKSQLSYCKKESSNLERNLKSYKELLEIQGGQIMELKTKQQDQETDIKNLRAENKHLKEISITLLELGATYEKLGKYQEAIEIYKLLIKTFPSSMEAISSRLKIIDIQEN